MTVVPDMVEILGPASVLGSVMEAITEPISVSGARSSKTETVNVGVSDPSLRLRSPQRARVTVNITAAR
jgi:YbbR domain-containing protein